MEGIHLIIDLWLQFSLTLLQPRRNWGGGSYFSELRHGKMTHKLTLGSRPNNCETAGITQASLFAETWLRVCLPGWGERAVRNPSELKCRAIQNIQVKPWAIQALL